MQLKNGYLVVENTKYNLEDVHFIGISCDSFLAICQNKNTYTNYEENIKHKFSNLVAEIVLNKTNFAFIGGNLVNINKIKSIEYNGIDIVIKTQFHQLKVNSVNKLEVVSLNEKLKNKQRDQLIK